MYALFKKIKKQSWKHWKKRNFYYNREHADFNQNLVRLRYSILESVQKIEF